jgi:hypothetical protein
VTPRMKAHRSSSLLTNSGPLKALALLDPLFASAALVVEVDDVLGWPRHVGDDESYARVEFARMLFDLGDDATRLRPGFGLMGEVRIGTAHFVRRVPDRAREQVANPLL